MINVDVINKQLWTIEEQTDALSEEILRYEIGTREYHECAQRMYDLFAKHEELTRQLLRG